MDKSQYIIHGQITIYNPRTRMHACARAHTHTHITLENALQQKYSSNTLEKAIQHKHTVTLQANLLYIICNAVILL